ncbi:hypothetical protein BJ165DRAFT_862705 [Panaeolus papilionaceus]|nr:hypothetical protein BJ165DRAFT_862705 [Panaeolus papilionaceus]
MFFSYSLSQLRSHSAPEGLAKWQNMLACLALVGTFWNCLQNYSCTVPTYLVVPHTHPTRFCSEHTRHNIQSGYGSTRTEVISSMPLIESSTRKHSHQQTESDIAKQNEGAAPHPSETLHSGFKVDGRLPRLLIRVDKVCITYFLGQVITLGAFVPLRTSLRLFFDRPSSDLRRASTRKSVIHIQAGQEHLK